MLREIQVWWGGAEVFVGDQIFMSCVCLVYVDI